MAVLPSLSGSEVVRAFKTLGWNVARQSGSHIIMTKDGEMATLSVPNHKAVAIGTLMGADPRGQSYGRRVFRSHLIRGAACKGARPKYVGRIPVVGR